MFTRNLSVAALSLSLLPCWAATPLQFNWPDGMTAAFSYTKSKTQSQEDRQTQPRPVVVAYRMAIHREPQGVVVRYEVGDNSELLGALSTAGRERVLTTLRVAMPPIRVTRTGEFEDIDDIDAFQQSLIAFYALSFPASAGKPEMQRMLESITSKELLRAVAEQQWNALVGSWSGAVLEPGESYSGDVEDEFPLVPGQKIIMTTTSRLVREIDCQRTGQARRCVELETVARSKDESFSRATEAFAKRVSGDPNVLSREPFGEFVVEYKARLVTEPDTLVPHELTMEKTLSSVSKVDGKRRVREETVYRFSYE